MKKVFIFLSIIFCLQRGQAQNPVNAYANVTAISGTSLSVNSVNETYHSFEDGDYVIIMQMQDDVIGTNTTNVVSFGNLGAIQSAGLFEVAQILSHTESASLPTSITLANALSNSYNIGSNAQVQLITFRFLGTNFTSTANIGTLAWNGTIGGVTAMSVTNVFTLGHSITANACGFRGGIKNTPDGYSSCDNSTYATALAMRYAGKGEGIYKRTDPSIAAARGKLLNAGGGGNDVNGGGGGGGNYLSGGSGGSGWTGSATGCSPIVGGLGGLSLNGSISGSRVFMGGGGGGGQENDGVGTIGGIGGGILFIKTGTLTTVSCAGISISANGANAVNANNDGAGGGGAGGSVVFSVGTFNVAGACPLTVSSNGGSGGNSNPGGNDAHGGGGGGGQGVVIYPAAQPTINISTNTIPGSGGIGCASCAAAVGGQPGTGPSNSGIVTNATVPLPVELVSFDAALNPQQQVVLHWVTAVEKNSKAFVLQRMDADNLVKEIATVPSTGSYSKYSYTDMQPAKGINYYRLKQVDENGTATLRPWVAMEVTGTTEEEMLLYPNPLSREGTLFIEYNAPGPGPLEIELLDLEARQLQKKSFITGTGTRFEWPGLLLPQGVYIVKISSGETTVFKKLVVFE